MAQSRALDDRFGEAESLPERRWAAPRTESAVGSYTVRGGKIVEMDILADPERLRQIDLTVLDN